MAGLWIQASWAMQASASIRDAGEESSCQSDAEAIKITSSKVLVLSMGLACIFMVPVLKMTTGIPPYMGMLLALGIIWFVTDSHTFKRLAAPVVPLPETRSTCDGTPCTPK